AEALNEAQRIAMNDDPNVFAIGQDIGSYGGYYGVTAGLLDTFGKARVMDTPISEIAITGASVGAALVGARPILEVGFVDFVGTCWDQIFNQAAKFSYMSGGRARVPMVIRMACGAGLAYGVHHSQSLEAWFTHIPGLKVVMPSTADDAKGLLLSAIDDDNPVIFLEHKFLYAEKGDVADGAQRIPIGRAAVARQGRDVTIIAWSRAVHWALAAAEELAGERIDCHVLDLRTLAPLDEAAVLRAVEKTGRVVVCHEACLTGGFGAEVIARVTEKVFDSLEAPPVRIAAPDIPVPSSRPLENEYLRPERRLADAVRNLVAVSHRTARQRK
ncbi:MAG: alpha-ketoacid dehydrogenase subunit beta, partial [Rhodospirillaceae bacterium]|nr:alpha-ketoacid dehydrogenase subunit beta [Rhodospirillaceae bacterium]